MFCPECRAEYRSGFTRCSDCDVPLVSTLPPEEVPRDIQEVAAFNTLDMVEAEAVKELLEASEIEVYVAGESSPLPGVPRDIRLMVNEDQADLAQDIIEEYRASNENGTVLPFPDPNREEAE